MALLAILLSTACHQEPLRPNILLVTFDTTRWDHMGWAGGKPGVTPMLDAMANRGTWFSQCTTAQPLTVPSHTSILTGQYPYHHGVRNNGTYIAGEENILLGERLKPLGYQTHAVVSAFVLDSQFGLDQGFDSYDDDLSGGPKQKMFMFKETRADITAARAALWLRQSWGKQAPFYLWVHFFDPHADYEPPADVAAKFPGDPYSGEISFADRELGRIFKELDELGQLENTLVIFTSDHGDSLGEHGEKTHGLFVYDSTTRVPLMMAGPGVKVKGRVDQQVRTVDIVPTVMDILGLSGADQLDGKSLKPLWEGEQDERTAYQETLVPLQNFSWSELRALRTERSKVIAAPRPEWYELTTDPFERHNRYGEAAQDGEATTLFGELESLKANDPLSHGGHDQSEMGEEARRKLSALGYVWANSEGENSETRADPKDRIQFWERFQYTQGLMRQKRHPEAVVAITQLLEEDPGNAMARTSLANALTQTGQRDKALEVYRGLIQENALKEVPYLGASRLLREMGQFEEAEALARQVITLQPENPEGYVAAADVLLDQERYTEAEVLFVRALQIDPHSSLASTGLGNCLNRSGQLQRAYQVLASAWKKDPTSFAVAYNLGVVSERLGHTNQAMLLYREALKLEPDHSMSWNNIGSLLDRSGKRNEAIVYLQKAHELDPENMEAAYNLAVMLLAEKKYTEALPLLESAIRLRPGFGPAHLQRGRALISLGQHDQALADLERTARQLPSLWLGIVRLELDSGNKVGAKEVLKKGLEMGGADFKRAVENDPRLKPLL